MSTSFPPLSINTGYNGNSSGSLSPRIAPSSPGGALSRDIERQLRKDPKKWLEYLGAQNKLKAKQQHVQLEQLKEQLMNDPEELRKLQREASWNGGEAATTPQGSLLRSLSSLDATTSLSRSTSPERRLEHLAEHVRAGDEEREREREKTEKEREKREKEAKKARTSGRDRSGRNAYEAIYGNGDSEHPPVSQGGSSTTTSHRELRGRIRSHSLTTPIQIPSQQQHSRKSTGWESGQYDGIVAAMAPSAFDPITASALPSSTSSLAPSSTPSLNNQEEKAATMGTEDIFTTPVKEQPATDPSFSSPPPSFSSFTHPSRARSLSRSSRKSWQAPTQGELSELRRQMEEAYNETQHKVKIHRPNPESHYLTNSTTDEEKFVHHPHTYEAGTSMGGIEQQYSNIPPLTVPFLHPPISSQFSSTPTDQDYYASESEGEGEGNSNVERHTKSNRKRRTWNKDKINITPQQQGIKIHEHSDDKKIQTAPVDIPSSSPPSSSSLAPSSPPSASLTDNFQNVINEAFTALAAILPGKTNAPARPPPAVPSFSGSQTDRPYHSLPSFSHLHVSNEIIFEHERKCDLREEERWRRGGIVDGDCQRYSTFQLSPSESPVRSSKGYTPSTSTHGIMRNVLGNNKGEYAQTARESIHGRRQVDLYAPSHPPPPPPSGHATLQDGFETARDRGQQQVDTSTQQKTKENVEEEDKCVIS